MKYLLTYIIIILTSSNALGQWTEISSGSINILYDIHFPTADTGYVVGENGLILKTIDNGDNWIIQDSGKNYNLNSVFFTSANIGFAVGGNSMNDTTIILKTNNGGATWTIQYTNNIGELRSVLFISSSVGFAVGDQLVGFPTTILKTADGGNSWNSPIILDSISTSGLEICFPTPDTGYITLYGKTVLGVLKSIDAGNTWSFLESIASFPGNITETCYFTDANTGYVSGWYSPVLIKTIDGGNSWSDLIDPSWTFTPIMYSIYFPSSNIGYAVGAPGIIKTIDAGATWQKQNSGTGTGILYSVFFIDDNNGYAVGSNGVILKTTNGGGTGINYVCGFGAFKIYPNPTSQLATLEFPNPNNDKYRLTLFDSQGRIVQTITGITTDRVDIERKNLTSGTYFFNLSTNKQISATGKLTIK